MTVIVDNDTQPSRQATWNSTEWAAGKYVDVYATSVLTPPEVQTLSATTTSSRAACSTSAVVPVGCSRIC